MGAARRTVVRASAQATSAGAPDRPATRSTAGRPVAITGAPAAPIGTTMADVGTLEHYTANRARYVSRAQAAARIGKSRRTIENYLAGGLPIHEPLPGVERIYLDELLAMWRTKMLNQRRSRFHENAE